MNIETIFTQLQQAKTNLNNKKMIDLFHADPNRVRDFSIEDNGIFLDFSKNNLDKEALQLLLEWAKSRNMQQAIKDLLSGQQVNVTEKRPALHTALRQSDEKPLIVNGENITPSVIAERQRMFAMVNRLNRGEWLGATGKPITDVVNLGIGGSDLGPYMAVKALQPYHVSHILVHFVSNVDPAAIQSVLDGLDPETTLFVVSSKSFTTPETLTNAQVAKTWLKEKAQIQDVNAHFIAITANATKAEAFGAAASSVLNFWDWVGGRYSIWSSIGFSLALTIGPENFEAFLKGAGDTDQHFLTTPLEKNIPVILGLIGAWYIHFWQADTIAILPYSEALSAFPSYLQQLDMESNGKSVQKDGTASPLKTGPIVWGQSGTNGQHAFYQLIHQGTHVIPCDFILYKESTASLTDQHQQLLANGLAQSAALMLGTEEANISANDRMPGNKPSNTLLFTKLTPYTLGQLVALYEHKTYVQGVLWNLNSFDQPGVELGKKMAKKVYDAMVSNANDNVDASTSQLIEMIRKR